MGHKAELKNPLFAKIILKLCFPLLLLGIAFSAIQLANKIGVLNEIHQLRSKSGIESVKNSLQDYVRKNKALSKSDKLEAKLASLSNLYNIYDLSIYNLLNRKQVIGTSHRDWTPKDFMAAEKSLSPGKSRSGYFAIVDKAQKQIIAYIPVQGNAPNEVYIARLAYSLTNVKEALTGSFSTLIAIFITILLAGIAIAYSLAKSILTPIQDLNRATQDILQGKLGSHADIRSGDEIEVLANTFNHMSDKLKEMQESAEDANPLTKLPGNQGIFKNVQKRIHERQKFVFFHVDLDRFKLFNDHFGLAKGDQVIQKTADVLKQAVKDKGVSNDFVGHQGGDDFVVVTRPDHAKELGDHICKLFDEKVRGALYPKEDLDRGYTIQLDRRGEAETGVKQTREFPLMSVSVAGITNVKREFPDYFFCMREATKAKKAAKDVVESICIIVED